MGKISNNPYQIHFGLKFYKQTNGYYINRVKERTLLAHRWVWENYNGPIPDNMDIHHKDANKDNNSIENLQMMNRSDHRKEHWNDENLRPVCEDQLNKVRPIEWLKSDEGKKSVSEKGKEIWEKRGYHKIKCENCGTEAEFRRWARFCCKKCYMNWRWKNVLKRKD